MPAFGIVEALDVVEHIGSRHVRSGTSRPVRSVFSDEYKLPIAALSQPLPERLTEQMTPVISHQSLILLAGALGGFNRSSQHLEEEVAMNRRALCGAPLVGSTERAPSELGARTSAMVRQNRCSSHGRYAPGRKNSVSVAPGIKQVTVTLVSFSSSERRRAETLHKLTHQAVDALCQ